MHMPLNFPPGEMPLVGLDPTTPAGSIAEKNPPRSILDLNRRSEKIRPPFDGLNYYDHDSPSLLETNKIKLEPVVRVNKWIYISKETLLGLRNTKEGIFLYNGGIYTRVCNSDSQPFDGICRLWINNKLPLLDPEEHGLLLNRLRHVVIHVVVRWVIRWEEFIPSLQFNLGKIQRHLI